MSCHAIVCAAQVLPVVAQNLKEGDLFGSGNVPFSSLRSSEMSGWGGLLIWYVCYRGHHKRCKPYQSRLELLLLLGLAYFATCPDPLLEGRWVLPYTGWTCSLSQLSWAHFLDPHSQNLLPASKISWLLSDRACSTSVTSQGYIFLGSLSHSGPGNGMLLTWPF